MKKFILIISLLLFLSFAGCSTQQDAQQALLEEIEQLKSEYEKYDRYENLIDALETGDYIRAKEIIEGYKGSDHNLNVNSGDIQEIMITKDNWSDYFEVKKITEWCENDLGEATGFITHVFIIAKEEYADLIDVTASTIGFKWSAICSVKNCDVDLENRMVAFENEFKSTSTTFGEPEKLSGTVSFSAGAHDPIFFEQYHALAEIGEVVIVAEYLLGKEMKPVCFDYDDISITQVEGILVLNNYGE